LEQQILVVVEALLRVTIPTAKQGLTVGLV
jgi:hypothetical protein